MRRLTSGIILVLLLAPAAISGQSVYSSIGMGDLSIHQTQRSAGMGLSGMSLPDQRAISLSNPALWHEAEFAGIATGIDSYIKSSSLGGQSGTFSFQGFNFHLPVARSVGVALGFAPYSQVNYNFLRRINDRIFTDGTLADSLSYTVEAEGSGGVGGSFLGFGWALSDRIAIGTAVSFLLGQTDTRKSLTFEYPDDYRDRTISQRSNVYGQNLVVGGRYKGLLRESDNIGFRIEVPLRLKVENRTGYSFGVSAPETETTTETGYLWPLQYGVSYSTTFGETLLLAGEGLIWQPQTDLPTLSGPAGNYSYSDGFRFGAGVEYQKNPTSFDWWERLEWRTGVHWKQLAISDHAGNQPAEYSLHGGLGIPFGRGNRLDFAVSYGHRIGFTSSDPVEDIFHLRVGITVNELWFDGGIRNN